MVPSLNAPFSKVDNQQRMPMAAPQRIVAFFKPILPATAAMLFLAVLISFVFFNPEKAGAETAQRNEQNATPQAGETSRPETENFVKQLNDQYPTTRTGTLVTARLASNLLYRLHRETTYQELITTDEKEVAQLTRQLDAQGIEYEVLKNPGDAVVLAKGEWIISWGGILYLPQPHFSF